MSDETHHIVDIQDPLPESSWLWRRIFVFATTAGIMWMLWGAIDRLGAVAMSSPSQGVPALLTLCKWIIGLTAMMATYYMVAPSAEQITKMVKTARLLTSGVQVAGKQVIRTPGSVTETAKTIAMPPAPPIPGAGEAFQPPASPDTGQGTDDVPWAAQPPAR